MELKNTLAEPEIDKPSEWKIVYTQLDGALAEKLAIFLEKNQLFETLRVYHSNFSENGFKLFARALQSNTSVVNLELVNVPLMPHAIAALAEAISKNNILRFLKLGHNEFNTKGNNAIALFQALKQNQSLTRLDFYYNFIEGVEEANALGEAIACHPCLKSLNLSHAGLYNESINAIADGLGKSQSLVEFTFDGNITSVEMLALAYALSTNHTLEILKLRGNIGPSAVKELATTLIKNSTLRLLDFL